MRNLPIGLVSAPQTARRPLSLSGLVLAGLLIGALDLVTCSLFWITRGVPPTRIAESLAALLLGADAYAAGAVGVVLGLLIEAIIGIVLVAGYVQAAIVFPKLLEQPRRYGLVYGAVAFSVFEWLVLPLSAAPSQDPALDWQLTLLLIFMFVLGIPSAILARRLLRPAPR